MRIELNLKNKMLKLGLSQGNSFSILKEFPVAMGFSSSMLLLYIFEFELNFHYS